MNQRAKPKSAADIALENRVSFGNSSHEIFIQQIENLMVDADMSSEDRQKILANMNCPCCGGNAASFTIKLGEKD